MDGYAYQRIVLKLQRNKMNTFHGTNFAIGDKKNKTRSPIKGRSPMKGKIPAKNHSPIKANQQNSENQQSSQNIEMSPLTNFVKMKKTASELAVVPQALIYAHRNCPHHTAITTPEAMQDHLVEYHEARYIGHGIYVYELPADWRLTVCRVLIGAILLVLIIMLFMVVFSTTSFFAFEDIYNGWDDTLLGLPAKNP